jgi:hypothetical protein
MMVESPFAERSLVTRAAIPQAVEWNSDVSLLPDSFRYMLHNLANREDDGGMKAVFT